MAESVKVAVRVRPFNSREIARKATLIIGMSGQQTTIKDPEQPKAEPKKFAFDYSYWSHDGFKEDANGYLQPTAAKYCDQHKVFQDLGIGVLDNAWKGYNCSLFAYGQTGSGKSYSMVGYGANKGIVPVSCEELFKRINEKRKSAAEGEEYQCTFSMMEIYNEQVRDLLNPKGAKAGGLKVRQHPSKGFYVDQMTVSPVDSYADIDAKITEGTKNRTVAATNMNATSSRAHTIVTVNFTQKNKESGQSMTKTSSINLVDLAGSERADSTGATGDRLKEGSMINQSLSTLGNVIKALADLSMGKSKTQVPYRDSVLTKLLKNALGGNSKTVMIAALSPADINFDETLSTLRFADRAKAIKTKAVVNESPTDKLIRELREENLKLMEMLKSGGVMAAPDAGASAAAGGYTEEEVAEMKREMEEAMKKNSEDLDQMKKTWEEQMKKEMEENKGKAEIGKKEQEKKKTTPYLWNLNEDPSLTNMITHIIENGKTRVGTPAADPAANIILKGLSIQKEHAIIINKNGTVTIKPCSGAQLMINGQAVKGETLLHHNDRVLFGSSQFYIFHHPKELAKLAKKKGKIEAMTFEDAQQEIAQNSGMLAAAGGGKAGQKKEDLLLQEDLVTILPMLNEANAMSEELDKKVKFECALISPQARGLREGRTEVKVKMVNMETGNEWMWDRIKFINRKYLMQEMYQNYVQGGEWDVPRDQDPFWEPVDTDLLIGSVHVYLQSIGYLIEVEENLTITDFKGNEQGHMVVEIRPCNKQWADLDDEFVDDPIELVGKDLYFKLKIQNILGLPAKFGSSYCKFRFYLDEKESSTKIVAGTINPNFDYEKNYGFNPVTEQLINYLANNPLVIEVWGKQKEEGDKRGKGAGNTKQLMSREKTMVMGTKQDEAKYKMNVELNTLRKRAERAELKVKRVWDIVDAAKKNKQDVIKVSQVDQALRTPARWKAAAMVIKNVNMTRQVKMGKETSAACVIQ
ncbi:kinesin-like protein KIF28P isoform X2 [Lineus longissimus]|uniref:kinesin-like protein KIF28P isoform X2 n=1 Tax=Lineus longissimus TaxID=88925 RepID=UPI002B4F598C